MASLWPPPPPILIKANEQQNALPPPLVPQIFRATKDGLPRYHRLPQQFAGQRHPAKCRGIFESIYAASSLLLKVLLFLAANLLILTAIALLLPHFFASKTTSNPSENAAKLQNHNSLQSVEEQLLGEFTEFQIKYSRTYKSTEERLLRFQAFILNMRDLDLRIRRERELGNGGLTEWGITEFFDWTDEEMAKLVMRSPPNHHKSIWEHFPVEQMAEYRPQRPPGYQRPKQWDWREKGVVTHVKNQLQCGSCWAFATAATVETLHAIANGTLVSLSEQQMIDCDLSQNGCEGGFRPNAFRYVRDNGLVLDSVYPYRGDDKGKCKLPRGPVDPLQRVFIDSFKVLPSDEEQIADWIADKGPVTFGMNATKGMYQYRSGIFAPTPDECAHDSMGHHAMEVVGFGEQQGPQGTMLPYWILKNSWGSGFGINGGYLWMRRGINACGLAQEVYTALINKKP